MNSSFKSSSLLLSERNIGDSLENGMGDIISTQRVIMEKKGIDKRRIVLRKVDIIRE